jgi:hypothetical protein
MDDESLLKLEASMGLLHRAASELAIEITLEWRSAWDCTERTRGNLATVPS